MLVMTWINPILRRTCIGVQHTALCTCRIIKNIVARSHITLRKRCGLIYRVHLNIVKKMEKNCVKSSLRQHWIYRYYAISTYHPVWITMRTLLKKNIIIYDRKKIMFTISPLIPKCRCATTTTHQQIRITYRRLAFVQTDNHLREIPDKMCWDFYTFRKFLSSASPPISPTKKCTEWHLPPFLIRFQRHGKLVPSTKTVNICLELQKHTNLFVARSKKSVRVDCHLII